MKLVLSARAWAKPATPSGLIVLSAPPASMMSASPSLIIRAASPIECAPVEQAVTTEWFGPIRPYLIETWPEVRLISRPWTKCGLTRPGPFLGQHQRFALDARQAADARTDRDAGALLEIVVHVGEAGVFERLAGGVDRVDDERIDLALDLVVDALVGIEAVRVILRLHLAGDLGLLVGGVEAGDGADAALARDEVLPGRLDVAAERRHETQTCHDDTAHHLQLRQSHQNKRPPDMFGKPFVPPFEAQLSGRIGGPDQPLFWSI